MKDKSANSTVNKFIEKTYRLVSEQTTLNGPISWSANGKSFEVTDIKELELQMPRYFNSDKYSSFVRQLNIYGFQIIKKGKKTTFRHPFFLKDSAEQLSLIKNKKAYTMPKHGFGQVLREIEKLKLSNQLLDDKLNDLENQEKEMEENHFKNMNEKDENLKGLVKVALTLLKVTSEQVSHRDLFEDLKAVNPLFRSIDGYPNIEDFIRNAGDDEDCLDGSVRYLCEYIMENLCVGEERQLKRERVLSLPVFNNGNNNNGGVENKEEKLNKLVIPDFGGTDFGNYKEGFMKDMFNLPVFNGGEGMGDVYVESEGSEEEKQSEKQKPKNEENRNIGFVRIDKNKQKTSETENQEETKEVKTENKVSDSK